MTLTLGLTSIVLKTKNRLTPLTEKMSVIEELGLDGIDELSEVGAELSRDVAEADDRGSLAVDELTKTSLVLHNAVRDLLLAAESREPEDELDGVDIAGDDNELSLVTSNEVSDVVKTEAKSDGALGEHLLKELLVGSTTSLLVDLLTLSGRLHDLSETLGVLDAALPASSIFLRAHLGHQLEQIDCSSLVQGVVEHVDCRRAL
jgi:hypothetical protein